MQTFSNMDYAKYALFILGCTTVGTLFFKGLIGLPTFFTVFLTIVGTQLALKFLGNLVIGLNFEITKEKKL